MPAPPLFSTAFRLIPLIAVVVIGLGADSRRIPESAPAMSIPQAAVLGVVEGFTEYLPVSSTGHLILAQRAMGIGGESGDKDAADAYAICIQLGAILAVLGLYASQILRMAKGVTGRDPDGLRLAGRLLVAFLPAAIVGLTLANGIKQHLFGLWPVISAWGVGGLAILFIDHWRRGQASPQNRHLYQLTPSGALAIGLFQCLAMWPGVSRSLVTILGALVVGLSLEAAVVFSFLLGALTLGAGTVYDGYHHRILLLQTYGLAPMLTGFIVAFVSALIAVRWMVAYLQRHGLALFGYYRIAIAVAAAALILAGILRP